MSAEIKLTNKHEIENYDEGRDLQNLGAVEPLHHTNTASFRPPQKGEEESNHIIYQMIN